MLVTNHVLSGALIGHATPTLPVSPGRVLRSRILPACFVHRKA